MDMINGSTAALQQPAMGKTGTINAKASAGSEGEGGFQKALVQQLNAETDASGEQTQASGLQAIVAQLEAFATQTSQADANSVDTALTLIEELVDQLEPMNTGSAEATEEQLEELQALLDSLNALLALLGVPTPLAQNASVDQQEVDMNETLVQVKTGLQDGLLQLQAALQLGTFKPLKGQEPFALVMNQLQSMASALTDDKSAKAESKTSKAEASVPAWLTAQTTGSKDAATLLQRLSQQAAVLPSMLSGAAQSANETTIVQQITEWNAQAPSESSSVYPQVFIGPDNVKEFAPLMAKATAAPTAFVLADEFAETMNGLIVSKLDIQSVNGLSEAKLMLFPEHLGQVDVRISMQNGVLTAVFQTDTAMAKDMLDNQMAQLRASLQAQGLNVEKLEVTHSPSSSGLTQQHAGQGHQGGQSSGNRQGFREEKQVTDNAFESDRIEQAAIQGLGYGRAINETA
ncbi:flagellar hook-length control protein FliK [Paenibacillus soyae]|uniref:Flagellar hook-length control protein FliK n=1 Tax=Paenibacillus soyae TaxID=2969249 RepID=A0A9X2MQI5_9BACL|nr:flagellar hook-length control protein FliK [Paenibacillus soyae]MCR2805014.1 flagellar hook-length control protein FliK [Paenibacillus soyae]